MRKRKTRKIPKSKITKLKTELKVQKVIQNYSDEQLALSIGAISLLTDKSPEADGVLSAFTHEMLSRSQKG